MVICVKFNKEEGRIEVAEGFGCNYCSNAALWTNGLN